MDPHAAADVADFLSQQDGLSHLRIRKYGRNLILYSGEGPQRQNHARLTALTRGLWALSLPHHTGRWDPVPGPASLEDILRSLLQDFKVYLQVW